MTTLASQPTSLTERGPRIGFTSHAALEDNALTLWLGAKLTALGYEVWADLLRLRGWRGVRLRFENVQRLTEGRAACPRYPRNGTREKDSSLGVLLFGLSSEP